MDTHDALRSTFSWDFLITLTAAGTVVLAVANTFRRLFRLSPLVSAAVAALVLTGYAAFADGAIEGRDVAPILIFTVVLFCYSAGINQSVVGFVQRYGRTSGLGSWQAGGWWDTWF